MIEHFLFIFVRCGNVIQCDQCLSIHPSIYLFIYLSINLVVVVTVLSLFPVFFFLFFYFFFTRLRCPFFLYRLFLLPSASPTNELYSSFDINSSTSCKSEGFIFTIHPKSWGD